MTTGTNHDGAVEHPAPASAGAPYFNFTDRLQAFYAARGMWTNGRPCGPLAAMLGPVAPFGAPGGVVFYVGPAQVAALMRDLAENGPRGMGGTALAQHLRRLREALKRAGEPVADRPTVARNPAADPASCPFTPLVIPPPGRARAAFEKHVFDCLRDVVDFQQTSAYVGGARE